MNVVSPAFQPVFFFNSFVEPDHDKEIGKYNLEKSEVNTDFFFDITSLLAK
jgi:hypothetical protein